MTWRCEPARGARGFTLIELLVVLVIMGLMLSLIVTRGPWRSRTLEAKGAAGELAAALREARSQAIGSNHPVSLTLDLKHGTYQVGSHAARHLPNGLAISLLTTTGEVRTGKDPGIRFDPDGSSTGGRITLADGSHKLQVGVDWLTGRVRVLDAP